MIAALLTAAVVFAITIYAFFTKQDLSYIFGGIIISSTALGICSLCLLFNYSDKTFMIYSCFGVILFGFYILYDTTIIIGGGFHEISAEDYILASMIIYMDIINMFLHILRLFGQRNRSN